MDPLQPLIDASDNQTAPVAVGGFVTTLPLTTPTSIITTASPASVLTTMSAAAVTGVTMPAPSMQQLPTQRARRVSSVDPSTLIPARRSSTRSIKRKKFDDELVESSLIKTERGGRPKTAIITPPQVIAPPPPPPVSSPSQTSTPVTTTASPAVSTSVAGVVSSVSSTPTVTMTTSQSQTILCKAVVDDTREHIKQAESSIPAKPPAEKRSKVSSGKSGTAAKGASSGKGAVISKPLPIKTSQTTKSSGKVGLSKPGHSKQKSKAKRSRKPKSATPALKDLGRWKPHDDLALITAVQQTNDLASVHTGVKFSCRFTLKEIEERWYALLYDQSISKLAMEAARQLHSDTVATIQGKALYSNGEEKLLGTFTSTSQPSVESFQSLLQQHPDVFHPARTAKTLHCHWLLMKQYHLLPDQIVQPMPRGDHILNLSDIEDFMNDDDIKEGTDEAVEQELALADRRNKREIRHLEQEMPKWQVLVDSVTGISMPDFDSQTLGVLRGRLVRYLMRSKEISLGRATKDNHVDVDLSLEGPAWKVSRRQGIIKLRNSGEFFIANEGKRPILVDGKPVMAGNKQKLNNNSVVEISCLRFTFLMNMEIINALRSDAVKTGSTSIITTS